MYIIDKRNVKKELFFLDTGAGFAYKNEIYIVITPKGVATKGSNKVVLNCRTNKLEELSEGVRVEPINITITVENYEN